MNWQAQVTAMLRRAPNAQTITMGGTSTTGPVTAEDRLDQDAGGEGRLARFTVAVVPADAFASFTRFASVTVAGTAFVLRDWRSLDDGLAVELVLAEAGS